MCGLKLFVFVIRKAAILVTPCVGVWIETACCVWDSPYLMSHPAWVCGLKLFHGFFVVEWDWSHPAWVCGLKPDGMFATGKTLPVTPCVGVWIETLRTIAGENKVYVTPCVGVWIETS